MKRSIFSKLIGCFIIYAAAIFITFCLCLVFEAFLIGEGEPNNFVPDSVIDSSGNIAQLDVLTKVGGWIEELDKDGNVTAVYGDKKTQITDYSLNELMNITSPYGKGEYIGFYIGRENGGKNYLCLYSRDVMSAKPTLMINNTEIKSAPVFYIMFFSLAVGEVVLISLYLKQKIKKPLDKIVEGMVSLKSGNDGARINIRTEAEFEKIVDTFNLMAEKLQAEKSEKEQLTKKKNRMLLELSHDIKTPVATIKSYANALEEDLVPEERTREIYRLIDAKANRVHKLTDDMFMMLKMDDPDYFVSLESRDLSEYLRQLCAEYYDELTEAGFEFEINIPEAVITADIDAELFSRVVANLLSNAKKYNKTGSIISVRLSENGSDVKLSVSDNGSEIDKAFSEQMFNAFSRGDKARKTDGGTGLGLAISRIIIEKHGGSIQYRRLGEWNVFEVCLKKHK